MILPALALFKMWPDLFLKFTPVKNTILPEYQAAKGFTNEAVFIDWCQGLPSVLDTCYYYNRSAVVDLGNILEQSERERAQYTEEQAERLLTHLIYQELVKGAAGR